MIILEVMINEKNISCYCINGYRDVKEKEAREAVGDRAGVVKERESVPFR